MPELLDRDLYDVTYKNAKLLSKFLGTAKFPWVTLKQDECLFRYSSQKFSDGTEKGARAVHGTLAGDKGNRWSGSDLDGGGALGMYFSLEAARSANTVFSELYHYLDQDTAAHDPAKGHKPAVREVSYRMFLGNNVTRALGMDAMLKWHASANRVHYMFKFALTKALNGVDLLLSGAPASQSFVDCVYDLVSREAPQVLKKNGTDRDVKALYCDPADASFCRAIGNACLETAGCDYLMATSTRDKALKAVNIVLNCSEAHTVPDVFTDAKGSRRGIGYLSCLGRSTWYTDFFKSVRGHVTEADTMYANRLFNPRRGAVTEEEKAQLKELLETVEIPVYDGPVDDPDNGPT